MYLIAVTGTAQQIINPAKLPVLSKILNKSMVTKGLALILSRNIKPFTNHLLWLCRISRTEVFYKITSTLDKTQRDLFRFWQSFP